MILGLVHVSADSFSYKAQEGNTYTVGARDDERPRRAMAGRFHRAMRNFGETFPLFAALVLVLHVSGRSGGWSTLGAELYLGGRIAYLPAYLSGIPYARTVCWQIAAVGIVMAIVQLFL
ncbi:MAG: MAPEG family protein [Myxococcales bacterium]|nr:MAPEG family protein [Myxococcales bacterium]